jgi:hypothetical protein
MGLWPGDWFYDRRYDYAREYVTILRELWATGRSDFRGEFFTMTDCRLSPRPQAGRVPIVCAGQSERGMQFCAAYGDYQFIIGHDDFATTAAHTQRLLHYAAQRGRDVGPYALYFIIPTTLLNEVPRGCAFSCARDKHDGCAVASQPRAARHHSHGRLSGATPLPITSAPARP